jgi:hypothetical protein
MGLKYLSSFLFNKAIKRINERKPLEYSKLSPAVKQQALLVNIHLSSSYKFILKDIRLIAYI